MSCRFSQNSSKGTMRSLIVLLYGSLWVVKARGSENLLSFPLQYRPPSEDINFSNTNTRRRLQGNGDGYTNRYDGYGVHFIDLFIGNPSQKRTLAVQTASDHTAFACEVRYQWFAPANIVSSSISRRRQLTSHSMHLPSSGLQGLRRTWRQCI
jgi:hypothetical protein